MFKVLLLLIGILWVPLGSLLMALDAHFHFTSTLNELKQHSPDWIIMRYFFGIDGFGVFIHRLIAVKIFILTVLYIYFILNCEDNFVTKWYPLYSKIVLSIITIGIIVKEWILGQEGVAFA